MFIGMNLVFMPDAPDGHVRDAPRIYTYLPQYAGLNHISSVRGRHPLRRHVDLPDQRAGEPSGAAAGAPGRSVGHAEFNKTLEWTVTSPPPSENSRTFR